MVLLKACLTFIFLCSHFVSINGTLITNGYTRTPLKLEITQQCIISENRRQKILSEEIRTSTDDLGVQLPFHGVKGIIKAVTVLNQRPDYRKETSNVCVGQKTNNVAKAITYLKKEIDVQNIEKANERLTSCDQGIPIPKTTTTTTTTTTVSTTTKTRPKYFYYCKLCCKEHKSTPTVPPKYCFHCRCDTYLRDKEILNQKQQQINRQQNQHRYRRNIRRRKSFYDLSIEEKRVLIELRLTDVAGIEIKKQFCDKKRSKSTTRTISMCESCKYDITLPPNYFPRHFIHYTCGSGQNNYCLSYQGACVKVVRPQNVLMWEDVSNPSNFIERVLRLTSSCACEVLKKSYFEPFV